MAYEFEKFVLFASVVTDGCMTGIDVKSAADEDADPGLEVELEIMELETVDIAQLVHVEPEPEFSPGGSLASGIFTSKSPF